MMTAGVENVAAFEAQLVAQVVDSLAMYMMENARFMAERLHAEFPKEVRMMLDRTLKALWRGSTPSWLLCQA